MTSISRAILQAVITSDASLSPREREVIQRLIDGKIDADSGETRRVEGPLLVTQRVTARLLGVSRVTIWRMAKMGILRQVEILPGTIRYDYREVLTLVDEGGKFQRALRVVGQEK